MSAAPAPSPVLPPLPVVPAPPVVPPPPSASRRRRSWPAGVLVVVLLAWFGVAAGLGLGRSDLPGTTASGFVPPDGHRAVARFGQGGGQTEATVENARIRGKYLTGAISPFLLKYMVPPPGVDRNHVDDVAWWREAVVPDLHHEPRYRVFSVTDGGVRLHGQDWGQLGLTLEPAPIWLPADVHSGQTWTGHGTAAGAGIAGSLLDYRMTATAKDARGGCVRVTVTTDLTPRDQDASSPGKRWVERDEWCPDRGVVESAGSLGDQAYSVSNLARRASGASPGDVRERTPDPADVARWRRGTLNGLEGDDTFGTTRMRAHPEKTPIVTASGAMVYRSATTFDVVGLLPLDTTGKYWQHWWARPAGQIQSLTAFGRIAVVTTSERRMLAYAPGGRLLWSATLDDVALRPPVRVSGDRLVVVSAHGLVRMRSALDGRVLWTHRIPHGVARPLATDGSVVAAIDTKHRVHVLDARTGAERWSIEGELTARLLAVRGGRTFVAGTQIRAYDNRTGDLLWHRAADWEDALRVNDTEVAVDTDEGVRLFDLEDGTTRGSIAGADDPQSVGNTWFVLIAGSLEATDRSGTPIRTWRLTGRTSDRQIVVGPTRVWVFGQTDGTELTGEWVGPGD